MVLGQNFEIFDWFIIHFTENNGMAFGIEFGGATGKIILTLFRIAIVIAGVFYIKSIIKNTFPNGALIALGLIIGGAVGNIIDSCFYGFIYTCANINAFRWCKSYTYFLVISFYQYQISAI